MDNRTNLPFDAEVQLFLDSVRGIRPVKPQCLIEAWVKSYDADHLYNAAAALELAGTSTGAFPSFLESLFDLVLKSLCLTPSERFARAALRLSRLVRSNTVQAWGSYVHHERHIAQHLASGQSSETTQILFDAFGEREKYREILACLLHEAVFRGADASTVPSMKRFADGLRASRHPLAWLPLHVLSVEASSRAFLPHLRADGSSEPVYRAQDEGNGAAEVHHPCVWLSQHPDGEIRDITTPEVAEAIRTAVSVWEEDSNGTHETKVFEVTPPLSPDDVGPGILLALNMECVHGATPSQVHVFRAKPATVFAALFAASSNGGAYNNGRRGAYGRLDAWRSFGALAGAPKEATAEEIVDRAEECAWFTFFSDSGWFADVAWDIGIACLHPEGAQMRVLAATDTD